MPRVSKKETYHWSADKNGCCHDQCPALHNMTSNEQYCLAWRATQIGEWPYPARRVRVGIPCCMERLRRGLVDREYIQPQ